MNIYRAQCQPEAEFEALGWPTRGNRRTAEN